MRKLLIVFSILIFLPQIAGAKNLYVATNGSDSTSYAANDIDHPWLTVAKAWADAQTDDVVYYRHGTYTISSKIDNASTGVGVTHTSYAGEQATWTSSLNSSVIFVTENDTVVDGIDISWTGAVTPSAVGGEVGFFILGWSSNNIDSPSGFEFKNSTVTSTKYSGSDSVAGANIGIVHARPNGGGYAENLWIENVSFTGAGAELGTVNTAGIIMFKGRNWTIKNCEFQEFYTGIFFNKHPDALSLSDGLVQNNYIHDCHRAIQTQTNETDFINNIIAGSIRMGEDSGNSDIDGNVGSDFNNWAHNTITGYVSMEDDTDGADNEYPGTQYGEWNNNVFPAASFEVHRYSATAHNYSGDYNLFPPASTIYNNSTSMTLSQWQTHLGGGCPSASDNECNSIEQSPTFVGGGSPSTIAGFALTSESYGYQACADGSDMGADVSLVGVDAGGETTATPATLQRGVGFSGGAYGGN